MDDLCLPLSQSEAFERTCQSLNLPVQRIQTDAGTCLVQSRKIPLLGQFSLASRGPVSLSDTANPALIAMLRKTTGGPLIINAPHGASGLGGYRIARGAELALIDMQDEPAMRQRLHQKWRNQLKKAEQAPIRIVDQPLDARKHAWFLNAEQSQQKARGYRTYPAAFLLAYAAANRGQARLYTALSGTEPIAGMLVLKHGRMATYQAGVTTTAGRRYCAHNLLLWRIMTDLRRKGFERLDLGRADLSPGLSRFKQGAGATIETLPGSFLFHKWLPGQRLNRSDIPQNLSKAA